MAENPLEMTRYDQVLVNALMALVLPVIVRPDEQAMLLDIIKRVLPRVNLEHHYVGELADWAENLLAAQNSRASEWHRATFQINQALAAFTTWRLGLLMDDMRAEKAAKTSGKDAA